MLLRYTGQSDISVGTPMANRRQAELEPMIGFFVNTLVMRTDLSGDPTFVEALRRVREVSLGAYMHQDTPFEKVVEELEPERDLSRSPLFQVMFALQNVPQEHHELEASVSIEPLPIENTTSKFDLSLSISQTEQGRGQAPSLRCILEYSTDLFEAETISRWLRNLQTLLEGVAHNPQARISQFPLLTRSEQEQILGAWNATQEAWQGPQDLCLHQLVEPQAEQ